jgi:Initiation factor 2 subunit family
MVSCLSRTPAPRASCTRDAIDFAAVLRQLPPADPDDERAGRAALAASASASGSAAARLIAQAAANHPALAPALVDDRFVAAARDVAKIVGTRPWRRILVAGPSAVVEQAVEAAGVRAAALNDTGDWEGITAVVLGDGDCATRLSKLPHVRVEFAPLAAASSVIASCDSVLLGAESVHLDGRLLVVEGVTGVTVLAASFNVPVYALVQTIKFESDLLLADTDKQGLEMLSKNLVAEIITEHGEILPSAASLVCKRYGIV